MLPDLFAGDAGRLKRFKILDFGLAKLTHPESESGRGTQVATVSRATRAGIVVGTVVPTRSSLRIIIASQHLDIKAVPP